MVTCSSITFPPLQINDNITLSVPTVDRGPLDFNNILGVVTDTKNDVYQIGTKDGILKGWFPRIEIAKSSTNLITMADVPKNVLTLREAAAKQSASGGQGYKKCNCKIAKNQCQTNRCFKAKILCNSRCHSSSSCINK
ncbi:unnamed protein product [Lasius platythorax]|uniref:Uncharacterized protein n=1 Tax=Lasius platythorax TaxID=488582 RepID=A0AAV2MYW3_9HYME